MEEADDGQSLAVAGHGLCDAAPLRVLEFYSGIGGMRYSLIEAKVNAEVVEAFDINDVANDVYDYNFGHRPHQGNIQTLTSADMDRYAADAWLLSPPCQPYTRQGLRKQSSDARASSFTKILDLIQHLKHPPSMLFVENVVGFETSDTHSKMMEILKQMNYTVFEFLLSPLQFGVPYSRPRYFCLAKRRSSPSNNKLTDTQIIHCPKVIGSDDLTQNCEQIKKYIESNEQENYVPLNVIERWGSAMDVVYDDSHRCCCFTKSYYRYVKGTGSLLATQKAENLIDMKLRFFTPREVANFHSFPKSFQFPPHLSLKQCYALLGNSLSVAVVSPLLRFLFSEEI